MKGTSGQFMVVGALIATILFAVVFTIQVVTTKMVFQYTLPKGLFISFAIMHAISLVLSSTSIFGFLFILTSLAFFFKSNTQKNIDLSWNTFPLNNDGSNSYLHICCYAYDFICKTTFFSFDGLVSSNMLFNTSLQIVETIVFL
uniref:Uncharacterized protein n=1 Tax=Lactuca sativa TaxID=4236 RepID=A0A9R1WQ05_LACSA|nr:hypothetical protein LSAT_V11C100018770 [Lactuca sativa]